MKALLAYCLLVLPMLSLQAQLRERRVVHPEAAILQIHSDQPVYREGKFEADAWGYNHNRCQTLEEVKGPASAKGMAIHWKYDPRDCEWAKWGINWNDWYPVDLRKLSPESTLFIRLKTDGKAQFRILLEDYRDKSQELYTFSSGERGWYEIDIDLAALDLAGKGLSMELAKQIIFEGTTAGEVYIDEIRITAL